MITLLTGNPGSGKTAVLVDWLRTKYEDRPLYVDAKRTRDGHIMRDDAGAMLPSIDGLVLDHEVIDATRWFDLVPANGVVVVDEVQKLWRPRGPGKSAPEAVVALEEHRHAGVDWFLTTQKPRLVDANVRDLVGRHVHLRDTGWFGRWRYEWPECSESVAWKTCHAKKRLKLPKAAFDLYKSAEVHTKVEKTKSPALIFACVAVVLMGVLAYMVWGILSRGSEKIPLAGPGGAASAPVGSGEGVRRTGAADPRPWPLYAASRGQMVREPLADRAIEWQGRVTTAEGSKDFFALLVAGQRVATVTGAQMRDMGYRFVQRAPCVGVLIHAAGERLITCGKRAEIPVEAVGARRGRIDEPLPAEPAPRGGGERA